ncbi:glycine/D-amino acid oxidase-like deaminating enzyme [Paenibacillus shirakamiensis]|uniref:Glycine/D-amino acid oxidase-like deaminating enzyme n=1 Tax=Paenibacillus shirakamiensis TaxID=1265935 RepID=A0ABS4JFJ2_9BACL|nr:FAD-dependent oxidoreductase [Paenibacillus shirakamiensis]MBP2000468.1 glycine/D-amino acid oxidase-like deaminating enzyme [Paenibacillus shirakamiensis]
MKLHAGTLLWENTLLNKPEYPALQEDVECNVLIIGSGMGGALCSAKLAEKGIDTILIDKGPVAGGSSTANTGLLQFSNDKTLTSCIHTFGEEIGVQFYTLCKEAVTDLAEMAKKLDIDPEFIPRSSLYFASSEDDIPMLQEEYDTLIKFGFPVEWWDATTINHHFPFAKPGAIYTHGDAEVNPYRFVHGLVDYASKHGVRVFEHTPATGMHFEENGVLVFSGDYRIRAKQVIFACGYETQEMKKDRGAVLMQSYAIATEVTNAVDSWHERCLIWETARPYLYMRTTAEGRIVIGGLDEELHHGVLDEARHLSQGKELIDTLHAYFPETAPTQAEYAWGAVFGGTHDGLPFFGPHEDYPHCFFVEGYGGNGTVTSMLGATLIADIISGTDRPELDLFALDRTSKPNPPTTS